MADPVLKKITALTQIDAVAATDVMPIVDTSEPNASLKNKKVRADQITVFLASQLSSDVVENAKIKDAAVTAGKLATDAVETAKIKNLNVTTGKIADNAVSNTKLRDSGAMSVIGRSANSTGDPADITAGTDGYVLRRSGTTLGFGQVASAGIASSAVSAAKLATDAVETAKIKDLNVTTEKIADNAVTEAKLGAIKRTVAIPVFGREDAVIAKNFVRIFSWPPMLNGHVVVGASAVLLGAVSSSGAVAMTLTNQNGTMATISIAQGAWSASAGSINATYDEAASFATFSINVTSAGSGAKGLTVYLEVLG